MTQASSKRVAFLLAALAGLFFSAQAQEKAAPGKEKGTKAAATTRDGEANPEEQEEEEQGLQIGKLLPLNKPNLRVKIPSFDKGELASMVEAEKLTRIDDVNLKLEDATIQMIPQELTIKLRSALYNTDAAILSSNAQTTFSSKEFTMTGESMDFDTRTGKGRMEGKTRMIIHNVSAMSGSKKPSQPAGESSAGKTDKEPKEEP